MSDDLVYSIKHSNPSAEVNIDDFGVQQLVLFETDRLLRSSTPSKSVVDFHLPMLTEDTVEEKQEQVLIFVYGPGGTGIVSLLLGSGRIVHSKFNIPIDFSNSYACNIRKHTMLVELLKHTSIVIWDEAPMSDRRCFECLDRSLRDILECNTKPFGVMSMLLGGDFRQTLTVSPNSTPSEIISLTLPNSTIGPYFTLHKLNDSMRLKGYSHSSEADLSMSQFASWLLKVGDGMIGEIDTVDKKNSKWIEISDSFLIPASENTLHALIDFVYGDVLLFKVLSDVLSGRAIVCPKNDTVQKINDMVLLKSHGSSKIYESADSIEYNGKQSTDFNSFYPLEYLNSLIFFSIPAHSQSLKIDPPIMLIRNINQKEGLCNGTRLMVSQLLPNVIEALIITGTCVGKKVFLPRIRFVHKAIDMPFTFIRKQFPVKVCYAIAINKSQGQSLKKIGIYLPEQVRILPMWTPQIRIQETWFLAVDNERIKDLCSLSLFVTNATQLKNMDVESQAIIKNG
ncbi:unnamed protein product [Lactuca saligna]|uniref:ATP-dependent DNA helicase n=1 Tax=Lactuca saligna TaxID=75948 RepID=A0AA35Y616_LACSI|nr:unnamed protein product [Lactuca saligna]